MRYYCNTILIMKLLIIILSLCLFTCAHSQEVVDTIGLRIQYSALYKHTKEQKEAFDDINLLDIGKHSSHFYSQRFEEFLHLRDSVKNVSSDPMSYLQFLGNMYGSKKGREYEVFKNIPQKDILTYTDALHNDFFFFYEENVPTFKWELAEGDTIILGYPCHKAICQFRGRGWTAWYALDLPFDNGPWKLGGFPDSSWQLLKANKSFHLLQPVSNRCDTPKLLTFNPSVMRS